MEDIFSEDRINDILKSARNPSHERIDQILNKASLLKGIDSSEAAMLLNIKDEYLLSRLFRTAHDIKDKIYGNRLVLFAPLYISNHCSNDCLYCGFRKGNKDIERRRLDLDEIAVETRSILEQGHKRILLLAGETTNEFRHIEDALERIYSVTDSKGSTIRRINLEIAPLSSEEFRRLAQLRIGTYTVFQETYHKDTYKKMHPSGKKSDYNWRLECMDRALSSGLHDVGIGALFGLYDHKFEAISLLEHARHLDTTYGTGPHTISVPRIEHAQGAPISEDMPYPVSDDDFKKIVAVLRCSVPYTGIILSTRESAAMRSELLGLGVSQISAGSRTAPGGYSTNSVGQFDITDNRSVGEVIKDVVRQGYIPSFCTSCYGKGRVGKDFMELAKPGLIKQYCSPNALFTFKEYLDDYADEETRQLGERLIKEELAAITKDKLRQKTGSYIKRIADGERGLLY